MSDDPIPASDPGSRLVRTNAAIKDRDLIQRRREIVGYLYCVRHMPMRSIVEYLKTKIDPPIETTVLQISRDKEVWRSLFRERFAANKFDALVEVGKRIASFDTAAARAWNLMEKTDDPRAKAHLLRVYGDMNQKAVMLLQDVGLLDRRIGTLIMDDPSMTAERIPTGIELQKEFESVTIAEGELVSEAERAWMYGDAVASETAAKGATDGGDK